MCVKGLFVSAIRFPEALAVYFASMDAHDRNSAARTLFFYGSSRSKYYNYAVAASKQRKKRKFQSESASVAS